MQLVFHESIVCSWCFYHEQADALMYLFFSMRRWTSCALPSFAAVHAACMFKESAGSGNESLEQDLVRTNTLRTVSSRTMSSVLGLLDWAACMGVLRSLSGPLTRQMSTPVRPIQPRAARPRA